MLFDEKKLIISDSEDIRRLKHDGFEVYYKGVVFVKGFKCYEESIKYILKGLRKDDNISFDDIRGNFFILIQDTMRNKRVFFTDNSGMFKSYIYKKMVSTSFLNLAKHTSQSENDFSLDAIVEFFHFGHTYLEKTFMDSIKVLPPETYILIEDGDFKHVKKDIEPMTANTDSDFIDTYHSILDSMGDSGVSIDATGGIDSRLNLALFYSAGVDFEMAVSGIEGNRDIAIAQKISQTINKPFYPTIHTVEDIKDSSVFDEIFYMTDGMIDVVSYHRNHQMNLDRQRRGVKLAVSGVGGELYKDFWWLQDIPFYNKKSINLQRLYKYRIGSTALSKGIFTDKLAEKSMNLKDNTIHALSDFKLQTNTQTYDNIYYNYKMRGNAGAYITAANNYFPMYAPLVELELVRYGFHLPRYSRFFNNFHRELITSHVRELSTIKTTENITVSSGKVDKIIDISNYLLDKNKRMIKKVIQKVTGKTFFQQSPQNAEIYKKIEGIGLLKESCEILYDCKILNANISRNVLPNSVKGKVITLANFIKYLH